MSLHPTAQRQWQPLHPIIPSLLFSPPSYVNMQVSYFEIYMDKIRDLLDGAYVQPHLDL